MNAWATAAMNPDTNQSSRLVDHDATQSERTYGVLTHLAPLLTNVITFGIPGLSIIAPIIMWQVRKNDSPFLDDHGRETVNFQLTILLISIASLGVLFIPAVIFSIVFSIIAAVATSKGEFYRYPCCIRLLNAK